MIAHNHSKTPRDCQKEQKQNVFQNILHIGSCLSEVSHSVLPNVSYPKLFSFLKKNKTKNPREHDICSRIMFYLSWHPHNKEINTSWQPVRLPICCSALHWLNCKTRGEGIISVRDKPQRWQGRKLGERGWKRCAEEKNDETKKVDSHMATPCCLIGGGHACSQAGKTRKCNSGRLSEYDIFGSYSIYRQTLKWRLAWRGGRKVTTVSSLPVNPTTPTVEGKIEWMKRGKEKMERNTYRNVMKQK